MPKEKSFNPVQAQRKAEKAKAIKKSKAEIASRRNEKLARRNPDSLQKQLDELKAIESSGGKLTNHEKNLREGLEKELRAVLKARESVGNATSKPNTGPRRDGKDQNKSEVDGRKFGSSVKRRREETDSSEDTDVPEDLKHIPMPRDTPPPIPKDVLDKWYQKQRKRISQDHEITGTNVNRIPLGNTDRTSGGINEGLKEATTSAPIIKAQTVYEAKPVIRDLRKEAAAFVPAAVRLKLEKSRGVGGLIEPDEAEKLEEEGYLACAKDHD